MSTRSTRRAALRRGLGAAGGACLAASLPPVAAPRAASAQDADDVETLTRLIELEQRTERAYRSMAEGDLLDDEVRDAVELFADQEAEHTDALTAALEDRGGAAPDPPRPADVEGLEDLDSQRDALQLAIDLENALVRAYGDAAESFDTLDLLKTCAQIVGNAGQHLAVLREQLGDDPVPEAFEAGEPER